MLFTSVTLKVDRKLRSFAVFAYLEYLTGKNKSSKNELFYAIHSRMSVNLQNQNGEGGGEEDRADHCFDARCSTDDSRCGSCKQYDAFNWIELTEAHLYKYCSAILCYIKESYSCGVLLKQIR